MGTPRRLGLVALALAPFGLAYRFALVYRARAGFPRRQPPLITPTELGLPFETTTVRSGDLDLPAWFIPARGGAPGPGVVLVHGWESARDRTLPMAVFLHAAGFHCLTFDVRGHGANEAEEKPISGGEFGDDALAAFQTLLARPEVTIGAISGHSMGGIGAILAAAADDRVAAVVATSAPADPYRLTRQTFRLARLPFPDPIAYPLAWLTTHVYVRPRGHVVREISATEAIARYAGPVLLAHGADDVVVPSWHMERLAKAARAGRLDRMDRDAVDQAPLETIVVEGGQHSWLYEFAELSARGRDVPGDGPRRPAQPQRGRRDRRRDAGRSDPGRRGQVRGGRGEPRRSPDPGPGRPSRRHPADPSRRGHRVHRESDRRRVVSPRRPTRSGRPSTRSGRSGRSTDRPLDPADLERILDAGRRSGSSKNRQRWDFIVVQDRDRLAGAHGRRRVGPAPGRCRGRRRARDARPGRTGRARVDPVRPRTGRPEHDAGGLGARDRQRAGHGLRLRDRPPRSSAIRPTTPANTCCRSAIRPIRPTSPDPRRPAAGGPWPRWSTRNAGSGGPTASGTSATRSRSTRPASRAGPRRRRTAARTRPRRP